MQLVSGSVKAKQLHSALLSEKQALADQLQQINSLIENSKIANSEEQVLFSCYLDHYLYIFYFDNLLNNCVAAHFFKQLFELSRSYAFYQKLLNVLKMKNTSQPP